MFKVNGIIVIGWIHPKNLNAIQKGCKLFNIKFKHTNDCNDPDIQMYNFIYATDAMIENIYPDKFILCGPHHFVFPSNNLIGEPDLEKYKNSYYNVLCEWNYDVFAEFGEFKIPKICLPFGVDTDTFDEITINRNEIFVYYKSRHPSILEKVMNIIPSNYKVNIIKYGSYIENDYIDVLHKCKFGIWIGRHESQGFALQEALSCNVPLIVLDVKSMKEEYTNGFQYTNYSQKLIATSVPFWSAECGEIIYNTSDLLFAISKIENNVYHPRKFIIDNLTIEKTMKNLITTAENHMNKIIS